jgi:hypothetical protein
MPVGEFGTTMLIIPTESLEVKIARLDEKIEFVRQDIRDLKLGMASRVDTLERDKADRVPVEQLQDKVNKDIEIRVRLLETRTSTYLITITLYSAGVVGMIGLMLYHIFHG